MLPDAPLSEAEINELEAFLLSDASPAECMDISMLDGYLTAIIIGPGAIAASEWMPGVWGEKAGDALKFKNPAQAKRIQSLVLRFHNDRVHSLAEEEEAFEPLIYQDEVEGETAPVIDEWCIGFITGMQLDPEGWTPLLEEEDDISALLTPIALYGTESGQEELAAEPELRTQLHEHFDVLGECVIGLRDYWLPVRKAASTYRRAEAKVNRNAPCPCGSGKKYKNCCGGQEALR
ncbi:MAG: UPF0149 family protein [Betaproteobacteria bacterium]|nr:UPF0149 family protein [Betaproteobacteria bacterium]